ncbi:hypothetical protein EI94DRAFT_1730979 [Lactarius quietus]|nr:hypothetical protein EI94DRAFT_1760676 [Lactarius quietus]KAF8267287.1 hypothetical protein EI94DRAFT_1730979 [Lactarius quietus]
MPVPLTSIPWEPILSRLPNQSQGWTASAHTEGKRYAHTRQAGITIVTEANIAEPEFRPAECLAGRPPLDNSDLFLELQSGCKCLQYYFVDHDLRTVFWLHTLNPSSVGLSTPLGQLSPILPGRKFTGFMLNSSPALSSPYSAKALHELQVVFSQPAQECEEFIDLLECSKGHASSPPVVICVARLWATVDAFFGFPDRYEARFKSFLVDQLIDPSCWRQHASETVEDWKQTIASTLTPRLFLCAFDLATTSFLLQRQQRLLCMNIPTSVSRIFKALYISYGLQPIAIVHSLPQALFVWALLLFSMQGFWAAFVDLPVTLRLSTLLPVASILATVGLGIWFIAYPRPEPPLPRNPTNERQTVDCMV